MLQLLLLVVVAAMAMYEPWEQPLLAAAHATGDVRNNDDRTRAPNDWRALFVGVLYRLGGNGGERHPA